MVEKLPLAMEVFDQVRARGQIGQSAHPGLEVIAIRLVQLLYVAALLRRDFLGGGPSFRAIFEATLETNRVVGCGPVLIDDLKRRPHTEDREVERIYVGEKRAIKSDRLLASNRVRALLVPVVDRLLLQGFRLL